MAGAFISLTPARLLDTRDSGGTLTAGETRSVKITGAAGIPSSGVSAVTLNVTVTDTTSNGYLTLFPSGTARPIASNLNWSVGSTIPNAVTVKIGVGGSVDVFQSGPGSADVIVDVAGYFADGTVVDPGGFTALAPTRILDTRTAGGKLASSEVRDLPIVGQGEVPDDVSAVVLNLTVTDTTSGGYLSAFPSGVSRPLASNVNWDRGVTVAHLSTVQVGMNGKVSLFQSGPGAADVIVDVAGYYLGGTATLPGRFVALPPARILDSRVDDHEASFGYPMFCNDSYPVHILGHAGVPATAVSAVVLNTTVTQTGANGFLTAYPGLASLPTVSNLNWSAGATIANQVTVRLDASGLVFFYNGSLGFTHLIVDVAGYYIASIPTITAISPPVGPMTGGSTVTITGTSLTATSMVTVGGTTASDLVAVSPTSVTVTVPSHAPGAVDVVLTTPLGATTAQGGFTYAQPAAAIAVGTYATCALTSSGTVRCWGYNTEGELGDGTTTNSLAPVTVSGLSDAVSLSAGYEHACVVTRTGSVECWGFNENATLGDGTTTTRLTPVTVPGLSGVVSVSAGSVHTCALTASGTVSCWGRNEYGQLGDGTKHARKSPVAVPGLTGVISISAGDDQTCALTASATVFCWGQNSVGQLGNGTTTNALTPVAVSGVSDAVALTSGWSHSCVLTASGGVRCWGYNGDGQLGDGSTTNRLTPVPVSGVSGMVSVSAGANHTCGVTASGSAECWGWNDNGQLGDGTTTGRLTPVTVSGLTGVASVAAAYYDSCALTTSGAVRCWGGNAYGGLGDGTTISRLTPVAVIGP